jgi:hypothetical protein
VDAAARARAVASITYKPGWRFRVGGPLNRYLCVHALTLDSLDPSQTRTTQHMFEMPDGVDVPGFHRWAFARVLDAERHEAAEFYRVAGQAPFWPNHQDEGSPYAHVERDIAWH